MTKISQEIKPSTINCNTISNNFQLVANITSRTRTSYKRVSITFLLLEIITLLQMENQSSEARMLYKMRKFALFSMWGHQDKSEDKKTYQLNQTSITSNATSWGKKVRDQQHLMPNYSFKNKILTVLKGNCNEVTIISSN